MEEPFSEWGEVFVLGAPSPLPYRNPLLKVFITPPSLPATFPSPTSPYKTGEQPRSLPPERALVPFTRGLLREEFFSSVGNESLTLNYSHPRFIEHPVPPEPIAQRQKPIVSILLLTAASTFTAWYVYRLTGQKLELQTQIKNYVDTLRHEKQAKAALISPQIKIITLEGSTADAVAAKIFWDTKGNSCLMYLNRLPPAAPDQYFQLWFLTTDQKFVKAKDFRAENRAAEFSVRLPQDGIEKLAYVLVSLESSEQNPFPEGPILVKGLFR